MDANDYLINDVKNYNKHLKDSNERILNYYNNIMYEYIKNIKENIEIKNKELMHFIIIRGIHVIHHIFNIMILYTKNMELTTIHTKHGYLYYIEFISQIGDDIHSYLQLNSKDAMLFSYKKTIYEIDNDYVKNFKLDDKDKKKLHELELLCDINDAILFNLVECEDFIPNIKTIDFLPKFKKIGGVIVNHIFVIRDFNLFDLFNKFILCAKKGMLSMQQLSVTLLFFKKILRHYLINKKKAKKDNNKFMEKLSDFSMNNTIGDYVNNNSELKMVNLLLNI